MDSGHLANFVAATRSRKVTDLNADVLQGHLSATCCHLANISHRLGRAAAPEAVVEPMKIDPVLADAVARYHEHLRANDIAFAGNEILGPALSFDPKLERFTGEFGYRANSLLRRAYRGSFAVPSLS